MLAKRIIPCLDVDKGRVVKGVNFVNLVDAGDLVENALVYNKEGADELVFLDITASVEKRKTLIELVERVSEVVFMPFTVGGGISTVDDIRALLLAGADKVSVNTAAVKNPKLIEEASAIFGSQCIVLAIDAKRTTDDRRRTTDEKYVSRPSEQGERSSLVSRGQWEVYIHGGRTPTGIDAVEWARKAQKLGAGEILLTSMDCDGTKNGFDIELTSAITDAVTIPVIASGGAGKIEHFVDVFSKTKATAALAASIFHFREIEIGEIKKELKAKKVEVRI